MKIKPEVEARLFPEQPSDDSPLMRTPDGPALRFDAIDLVVGPPTKVVFRWKGKETMTQTIDAAAARPGQVVSLTGVQGQVLIKLM